MTLPFKPAPQPSPHPITCCPHVEGCLKNINSGHQFLISYLLPPPNPHPRPLSTRTYTHICFPCCTLLIYFRISSTRFFSISSFITLFKPPICSAESSLSYFSAKPLWKLFGIQVVLFISLIGLTTRSLGT